MSGFWKKSEQIGGDNRLLSEAQVLIENHQSPRALERIESCKPSDAKTLVTAMAESASGSEGSQKKVIELLAPLLLKLSSGLTRKGQSQVRLLLLRAAQVEDLELASVMENRGQIDPECSVGSVVKSFFFGPSNCAEQTLYTNVLTNKDWIAPRWEGEPTLAGEYKIEFLKNYASSTHLTEASAECVGGGYFLVAGNYGCVIDPGYDFLDNFLKTHSIADINAVVVTHCHDDHNADFPALLSLLRRYQARGKKVQLHLDQKTFDAQKHLICSESSKVFIRQPCEPMYATIDGWQSQTPFELRSGLVMRAIPAFHKLTPDDESNSAVGLHFERERNSEKHHLVISGDTAWTPEISGVYEVLSQYHPVLVAHVSTAQEKEALGILGLPGGGYYSNHLGVWGTAEMIRVCKPSKVVLSEIGEELKEPVIQEFAKRIEESFGIPCLIGMLDDSKGRVVLL